METMEQIYTIKQPEPSEWQCHLLGDVIFHPTKGNEPNWFWRWMQYLAFGFRWERKSSNGQQAD
jgi:hypothetical protein